MYFLDSDYIINFLNGDRKIVESVSSFLKSDLATSVICVAEILEGLLDGKAQKEKTKNFVDFLNHLDIFDVDLFIADAYSKIRREMRRGGNLIDKFDLLIACTCLVNNLVLVTGNVKHFERIKGLKIYKGK